MEYAKDEIFEVKFKEKRTSKVFLKVIILLTVIFSIVNCICIYDFYRLLCKL